MAKKHVTIIDVAREAGVDNSTVSLALRGDERITLQTRERIRQAAARLHYVPNHLARSLSSRRSHVIGVMLTDMENRFYVAPLEEFQAGADRAGLAVSVKFSGWDPVREDAGLRQFCEARVDGLIWVPTGIQEGIQASAVLEKLRAASIPIVTMGSESLRRMGIAHCVGMQSVDALHCGASYLMNLGHRRIGFATAASKSGMRGKMHRTRLEKARIVLAESGGVLRDEDIFDTTDNEYGGVAIAASLVQRERSDWPTAIFAGDDMLARGLVAGLTALSVRVPQEISVLGYDDAPGDAEGPIPVTSVSIEAKEMGQRAIELLLDLIEERIAPQPLQSIMLKPRVVERASCAPPERV